MSDVIATVVIETEGGPVTINKSDFDAKTMEIFKEEMELNPDKMKAAELKAELDAREIEYTDEDKAPALKELLKAALEAE